MEFYLSKFYQSENGGNSRSEFEIANYDVRVQYVNYSPREHIEMCNGLQARLADLHEWIWVSLVVPFIRPRATSKKRASWITAKTPREFPRKILGFIFKR